MARTNWDHSLWFQTQYFSAQFFVGQKYPKTFDTPSGEKSVARDYVAWKSGPFMGDVGFVWREPYKALDSFFEVVHGLGNEEFLIKLLKLSTEVTVTQLETLYYLQVRFIELSIQ